MKKISLVYVSLLLLVLAACQPAAPTANTAEIGATQPQDNPTPQPSDTAAVNSPEQPTPTAAANPPSAEPAHPYAGLVFTNAEGLWLVNREGQAEQIIGRQEAALSPDGRYAAFVDGPPDGSQQDIYLLDRQTGEQINLTNTPDRRENAPGFWAANPDIVLFGSENLELSGIGYGAPTVINLDGSGYRVLDENAGGPMAPAPDGNTIAYGCCDAPGTLYRLEEGGGSPFSPQNYGIPAEKLFLPTFGPSSSQLAWILGGSQLGPGESNLGVGIFDLESGEGRLLHLYSPLGGTEFSGALAWSPDGAYLAYVNQGEVAGQGRAPNLWLLLADGSQEFNLGIGHDPVWSPDGGALAYSITPEDVTQERVYVVQTGDWGSVQQTPYRGEPVGWIQP